MEKILAPEHHADTTEMYYLATPGIRVYIASTPILSKQLLIEASKSTDPVIFLEPTAMYHKQVDNEACNFHIKDGARVLRNGSDITIISYGNITYDIQNMLMSDSSNLSIEHIELFRLKPVPTEIILNSVRKTGRCLIAHDTNQEFGPSKEIANLLYSTLWHNLLCPIQIVGSAVMHPTYALYESQYQPNVNAICQSIENLMEHHV